MQHFDSYKQKITMSKITFVLGISILEKKKDYHNIYTIHNINEKIFLYAFSNYLNFARHIYIINL